MRYFFKILIITVLFTSCKHISISDNYKPKHTSKQLQERLERYYIKNSIDSLRYFVSEWKTIVPSSTVEFINQDDTLENIFQIFNELYKPYKFGNENAETYSDKKIEFVIIQNEIKYFVFSSKDFQSYLKFSANGFPNDSVRDYYFKTKQLLNFRPLLSNDCVKFLFLTNEYRKAINDFLVSDYKGRDSNEIYRIPYTEPEIYNKYQFLGNILQIVHGHGGQGWYLTTFPEIYSIKFDDKFQNALVNFRKSFNVIISDYHLIKIKGHWKADKNEIIRMSME